MLQSHITGDHFATQSYIKYAAQYKINTFFNVRLVIIKRSMYHFSTPLNWGITNKYLTLTLFPVEHHDKRDVFKKDTSDSKQD